MGGNAFKGKTVRLPAKEFYEVQVEVLTRLRDIVGQQYVLAPPSYWSKESFGDLDLVVNSFRLPHNYREILTKEFDLAPGELIASGACTSFVFKSKYGGFQVDLIKAHEEYFLSSYDYFSYNDIWNLIGRLSHKLGVKTGHNGLSLVVRPSDPFHQNHVIGEVILSRDILKILPILGLDVKKYREGFQTPEEMFEYVSGSKFFNPENFLLDNRSSESRRRDRTRKTYNAFLQWIQNSGKEFNHFQFERNDSKGGYSIREPYYTELVLPNFPHVDPIVNSIIRDYEILREFKTKVNGEVITHLTGLTGKDLGDFKKFILGRMPKESWYDSDQSTINAELLRLFGEYDERT